MDYATLVYGDLIVVCRLMQCNGCRQAAAAAIVHDDESLLSVEAGNECNWCRSTLIPID